MVQANPLDMAKTVLGLSEGKDREALIEYMKRGGQNLDPQTRAWCAAFINASLEMAGYSGTGSDLAKSFAEWGQAVEPDQIQPGDVAVYNRGNDPTYGHAGLVEAYDPETGMVTLVSGNAGNEGSVLREQRKVTDAVAYRRAQLDAEMKAAGYTPEQRRDAIASIESKGAGDYGALGAWTGDPEEGRDRAYGRYQVMGSNIGPWAEQYLKKSGITSEQFLADPKLQDELFDAVYGDYVSKYGERGAASKWFTGSEKEPERSDVHGRLTGRSYADEYMKALEGSAGHVRHSPNPTVGTDGFVAPGAPTTPATPDVEVAKDNKKKWWQTFGESMAEIGSAANSSAAPASGISDLPRAALASTAGVTYGDEGSADAAELKRQGLAQIMARLNTQKLWS